MDIQAVNISREFIRKGRGTNVFTAVKPCDFSVPAGQLTVVRGRSGGGKSTLLNMLSGVLSPTTGTVTAGGADLYAMKDEALSAFRGGHFGYVPQGKSAVSSLTVRENILLPCSLYGLEAGDRAEALMDTFEISHLADILPGELSGGELRRMAIARALVRTPGVLFADEPTGDLDDENTEIVFRLLKEEAEKGTAVLVVTHESEAVRFADRIFTMDAGELHA